jgi:predicted amidohydrolase YtcJ
MRKLLLVVLSVWASAQDSATLIVLNGRVWTGDARHPWAQAVAVRGEKILAVGTNARVLRLASASTERIDAKGRLVTPGFNDAHTHFLSGSTRLFEVDLTGACTLESIQQRIAQWVKENPNEPWVTGGGWEYNCFPDKRLPTRQDLDAVVTDRPALLRAYDGHTSWVNSKALAVAGITKDTKFTGFGEVVKDAAGEPTGCFKESAATLVARLVPPITRQRKLEALERGLKLAASLGITSIQNASGTREEISIYEELLKAGKLTMRVDLSMSMGRDGNGCARITDLKGKYAGPVLRVAMVKFLIDGVIESHTAAMLDNYSDGNNTTGQLSFEPGVYKKAVKACADDGWQVETHAIGDRAIRLALDAYEALPSDARPRVEHIETIHPRDIARFGKQGVIASFMPIHADPATVDVWSAAVGKDRLPYSFAWRSLENAGARLVFSSDWPASISVDPIRGLHNAVNRQTVDGKPKGGWLPQERVSMETALRAYTVDSAYASFQEGNRGTLAEGQFADFVILSQDLFRVAPATVHQTKVDVTVWNGKAIFRR